MITPRCCFPLILVAALHLTCGAEELPFSVTAKRPLTVKGEPGLAIGTLISFKSGSESRFYEITGKKKEGEYLVTNADGEENLEVGAKGVCRSPLRNFYLPTLAVEREESSITALKGKVGDKLAVWSIAPSSKDGFQLRSLNGALEYRTPFSRVGIRETSVNDATLGVLAEDIRRDLCGYTWLTLDNPKWEKNKRARIRPTGRTSVEFTARGDAIVPDGHALELELGAGQVGGAFVLLEVGYSGNVRVMSSWSLPTAVIAPETTRIIELPPQVAKIDYETNCYVLLISKQPRRLTDFRAFPDAPKLETYIDDNGFKREAQTFVIAETDTTAPVPATPLDQIPADQWDCAKLFVTVKKK